MGTSKEGFADLSKKAIAELMATYALVFFGTGAIIINDQFGGLISHGGIALSFGLVVLVMIYAFGNVSGAHINPAVSLAFWASNKITSKQFIIYISAQIVGALLASLSLFYLLMPHETMGATLPSGSWLQSFVAEVILSFFLMLVIFRMADHSLIMKPVAGFAIGATVWLGALVFGPVSGASMNPARSLAPALVSGQLNEVWIYLLAPAIGMLLAAMLNRSIFKNINLPLKS